MPEASPPRPKKSGNGCLIALAIVGGLFVLVLALAGFGLWKLSNTKEGKAIFGAIGEATKIAAEAQKAPGAAEVRALGCDQAMVMDMSRMSKLFEELDASVHHNDFSTLVICQVGLLGSKTPSCDEVAHTYKSAVGASARPFAATVKHQGHGAEACSSVYDADGKKVRDLPLGSTPHLAGDR